MPAVTVGIPAYKAAHLGQAIASVLAQTFADFELIISDDCPDSSVREVAERFADPRIRLIEGPRRGLIPNSAHLWESARCDLLKYVYDDDFLLPFALAELVALIRRDPQLTYAFCGRYIVDEHGSILHASQPIRGGKAVALQPRVIPEVLIGEIRNPIGEPSNILIRRSRFSDATCLGQYGGVPISHHIDVAFYLNAGERGPCAGSPDFGAAFRRHPNQVTSLRTAPGFAASAAEWEIFVRAAVSRRLVEPAVGLKQFPRLHLLYDSVVGHFPELAPLAAGLADLRARLEQGDREVLDADFLARLTEMEASIARRMAAA